MDDRQRARLNDLHIIGDALRSSSAAPDLSSSILARVDAQRGFVCKRGRIIVWLGRSAAALTVALVALGMALAYRANPGSLDLQTRATPASDVIDTVTNRASQQLAQIRGTIEPSQRGASELSAAISGIAPMREFTEPIGAAVLATNFVGPPMAATAELNIATASGRFDSVQAAAFGGMRVSIARQSAWPHTFAADSLKSQGWQDDDAGLLMGLDGRSSVSPR